MTAIKKFSWVPRASAWEYAQAWTAQRRKMTQRFLEEGTAASTAFANAHYNMTNGMTALAQQAAIARLQKTA
jgi:hypothetical protein